MPRRWLGYKLARSSALGYMIGVPPSTVRGYIFLMSGDLIFYTSSISSLVSDIVLAFDLRTLLNAILFFGVFS
jgi:hypothetical protein